MSIKNKTACLRLYKCDSCKKEFTVRVGTIFKKSRLSLYKCLVCDE